MVVVTMKIDFFLKIVIFRISRGQNTKCTLRNHNTVIGHCVWTGRC